MKTMARRRRASWARLAPLLIAIVAAGGAGAQNLSFSNCDGRPPPTRGDDGSDGPLANPFTSATPATFADHAAACDKALDDPALAPGAWARRMSLLEARALWRQLQGQSQPAASDLAAAEALGVAHHGDPVPRGPSETTKILNPLIALGEAARKAAEGKTAAAREVAGQSDAQYARSGALDLDMIRTMARAAGSAPTDRAAAQIGWERISAARAYDGLVQVAVLANLRAEGADPSIVRAPAARLARLGRTEAFAAISLLLDVADPRKGPDGGVAQAVVLYRAISSPPDNAAEKPDGHETYDMEAKRLIATAGQIGVVARLAYRQLQAGDAAGARATFADAGRMERDIAGRVDDKGRLGKVLAGYRINHASVQGGLDRLLRAWSQMMTARGALEAGTPPDLRDLLAQNPLPVREEADLLRDALARQPGTLDVGAARLRIDLIELVIAGGLTPARQGAAIWEARVPAETIGQVAGLNRGAPLDLSRLRAFRRRAEMEPAR
ncbi:MAG: hypothetical protein ACR2F8_02250 [Caulobacteraceae bacterium]